MSFADAWKATGRSEGGFTNNPNDKGGPTNHGISEVVARANGWTGKMEDLPPNVAEGIAKTEYWDPMRLDAIELLSKPIAKEMFDSGFLHGIATVSKWLQIALNAYNRQQKDYADLKEDGQIGAFTVTTLQTYLRIRQKDGELVMMRTLNGEQLHLLVDITRRNQTQEDFLFGWVLNRVVV